MNDRNGLLEELGECKILDVKKGAKRPGPDMEQKVKNVAIFGGYVCTF